jgi:hypothetical protein
MLQLTLGPGVTSFVVTLFPLPLLLLQQPLSPAARRAAVATARLPGELSMIDMCACFPAPRAHTHVLFEDL